MSKHVMIIAEAGINHSGNLDIAKKLIKGAKDCGCDAIKFQKRTVELVYSKEELDKTRESPFGKTNRELKEALEFNKEQYDEIDRYCKEIGIDWFASAWDLESQKFLKQYDLKYNKVASAMLTHRELLTMIAKENKHTFISTGMSTFKQIRDALEIFQYYECPVELMHCCSDYPMNPKDANLNMISKLFDEFCYDVGYSGHETGIIISCAAAALGASSIERHITLDRSMYGSDQASSLELGGLRKLVTYIRTIEDALGDGVKKITEKEKEVMKKLRKVDTL